MPVDTSLPSKPHVAVALPNALRVSVLLCLLTLPIGYFFLSTGLVSKGADASPRLVALHLFVAQDMWIGPVFAAFLALGWWMSPGVRRVAVDPRLVVPAIALFAALVSIAIHISAFDAFGLSLDEFMPTFQAETFRSGNIAAVIDDAHFSVWQNLQPYFAFVDPERQVWLAHYRPVHAAMLSLFPPAYAAGALHAILSAITVLAIADIARRLWPEERSAPVLAALLLVGSAQTLVTSASGFAFTAHLAFNTVWLALFLRGSWRAHIAAAALGFLAIGLHQVHVHALFVVPFGLAMLAGVFGSRWKAVPYAIAYFIAVPLWMLWPEIAVFLQTGDISVLPRRIIDVEYVYNYLNRSAGEGRVEQSLSGLFLTVNLSRFVVWLSPALVLLLVLALLAPRKIGAVPLIAGSGFLFMLVASHLLLPNQMHTLGSRYYHPVLSNLVIVGLAAYYAAMRQASFERLQGAVIVLIVAGLALLPVRAWQTAAKVKPRAEVQAAISEINADAVVLDPRGVWFAADFARNSPMLTNRPLIYVSHDPAFVAPGEGTTVRIDVNWLRDNGLPYGTLYEPAFR